MVLDGRVPDDGACVELGYAYARNKTCYGIKTDGRTLEADLDINPMLAGCFKTIFNMKNINSAVDLLKLFLKNHSL